MTTVDSVAENGDFIWGAENIGAYIGRTERQTFHLLQDGKIPARKIGERWVASKAALRRMVEGEAA